MTFFKTIELIMTVRSDFICIVMNIDKNISFFYLKLTKMRNIDVKYRPALRTETHYFEYIAQRNNIKTSYCV